MKVLYVYDEIPGTYQHYLNILLQKAQDEMAVKTLSYVPNDLSDYCVSNYGWRNRLQHLLFKYKLAPAPALDIKKMQAFEIVHIQHSFLWKRLLHLLELKKRPKIVITLRGGDTYLKPWTFRRLEQFYQNQHHSVAAYITMSTHQKQYLQRWGVPEHKIHIIPISFGNTSLAKAKLPNASGMRLVSAFRMTWEKNIEGHIKFAKQLKEKGVQFTYDIYGNGHDIDQLYYLVDRYQLSDCISIKGAVDNAVLKEQLSNYDFFIQLSISESLGMSVIEAQSQGVPCVVSDSGGLAEAVLKNKTAIVNHYTEIDDLVESCINLWDDKELYHSYSKAAIDYVNHNFTTAIEINRLKKMYASI